MNNPHRAWPYRIRLSWRDIHAAMALTRSVASGAFRATIQGNVPVIDFGARIDALAVVAEFPDAVLIERI